ncbi:MAG: GAF domain-containing protein, partial [Spirochaetes bacterium]|nr:GAF domain-containing protein [Spirochaetota bacterium]
MLLQPKTGSTTLYLQIANEEYRKGGAWSPLRLGANEAIQEEASKSTAFDIFLVGCLLAMAFYQFVAYITRRNDTVFLVFSLFCAGLILRILATDEMLIARWTGLARLSIHAEFLSMTLSCICGVLFWELLYPDETKKFIGRILIAIQTIITGIILFLPISIFNYAALTIMLVIYAAIFYAGFIVVRAALHRRPGARTFLFALATFALAFAYDFLAAFEMIPGLVNPHLTPYGTLLMLLVQSTVVSRRFAMGLTKAEVASLRMHKANIALQQLKENLETQVYERTFELTTEAAAAYSARQEIERLNSFIKEANAIKDITALLDYLFDFILKIAPIGYVSLLLLDENAKELYGIKFHGQQQPSPEMEHFMHSLRLPLNASSGSMFRTYSRQKPLYITKFDPKSLTSEFDKDIVRVFQIHSFFHIPLNVHGRVIGILFGTAANSDSGREFKRADFARLVGIAEQVAATVEKVRLLQRAEDQALAALEAKIIAEAATDEIAKLTEFSKLINEITDLDTIIERIFAYLSQRYKFDGLSILLNEQHDNRLYYRKAILPFTLNAEQKEYIDTFRMPIDASGGINIQVLKHKRPLYVPRYTHHLEAEIDRQVRSLFGFKSLTFFPLMVRGEGVGVLHLVNFEKPIPIKPADMRSIARFVEQIAGTLFSTGLLEEVQHERMLSEKLSTETRELNSLLKRMHESLNIDDIMRHLSAYLKETYAIEHYALHTLNEDETAVQLISWRHPDFVSAADAQKIAAQKIPVNIDKGAHSLTLRAKKPIFFHNPTRRGATEEELFTAKTCRLEKFMIIPLILENKPIGFLDLSLQRGTRFTGDEMLRFSILGEQIAGTIFSANMFEKVQRARAKIEETQKETAALNELFRRINETIDLDKIMRHVGKFVEENFGLPYYALYSLDAHKMLMHQEAMLYPSFVSAADRQALSQLQIPVLLDEGAHAFTYRAGKPVFFVRPRPGASTFEEQRVIDICKVSYFVILPLIAEGKLLGYLDFFTTEKIKLGADAKTRLSILGEQITGALNSAGLFKQVTTEREKSDKLLLRAPLKKTCNFIFLCLSLTMSRIPQLFDFNKHLDRLTAAGDP